MLILSLNPYMLASVLIKYEIQITNFASNPKLFYLVIILLHMFPNSTNFKSYFFATLTLNLKFEFDLSSTNKNTKFVTNVRLTCHKLSGAKTIKLNIEWKVNSDLTYDRI